MKKLILILIIGLTFTIPVFASGDDDKTDRLTSGQNYTFSPGYLNAAKQRTESILRQEAPKKSFFDRAVEYVQSRLGNKVSEIAQEKQELKPNLQMRSGAAENTAQTIEISEKDLLTGQSPNNAIVEEALSRISVNQSVTKNDINYTVSTNGNTLFNWAKEGKMYGQIYDKSGYSKGNPFLVSPNDNLLLKAISNDRFVVAYGGENEKALFKIFNSDGSIYREEFSIDGVTIPSEWRVMTTSWQPMTTSIASLSDGRFAVAWTERVNSTTLQPHLTIFNPDLGGTAGKDILLPGTNWREPRPGVITLANGNIAVTWQTGNWPSLAIYDSNGGQIVAAHRLTERAIAPCTAITALPNGGFVAAGSTSGSIAIYDSAGKAVADNVRYANGGELWPSVNVLPNGNILVVINGRSSGGISGKIFSQDGKALSGIMEFGDFVAKDWTMKVNPLSNDTFSVSWQDSSGYFNNQYNSKGDVMTRDQIHGFAPTQSSVNGADRLTTYANMALLANNRNNNLGLSSGLSDNYNVNNLNADSITAIFKSLMKFKNDAQFKEGDTLDQSMINSIVDDALMSSALSIPQDIGAARAQEMRVAIMLADILKNPTADQKMVIDAAETLLKDIKNIGGESVSPELKKASDDLLQMVATVLLAQAIPDLLKEGDIQGIKGIFKELDTQKTRIMREYETSTTPYYDKLKKDILKNATVLQLNNVISNTLAEEELKNMQRSEIDRIMEKLKKLEKRSFEEDYILQQESKYRKDYLDPNKQKLEDGMKNILQNTTKKLSATLEAVPNKK